MKYMELISKLSKETNLSEEDIRKVLDNLPELLMSMDIGEKVRTPLGTFFAEERPEKRVQLPNGEWSLAKRKKRVRIRPSSRMQIILDD
mgnify:CR=1 FL=1